MESVNKGVAWRLNIRARSLRPDSGPEAYNTAKLRCMRAGMWNELVGLYQPPTWEQFVVSGHPFNIYAHPETWEGVMKTITSPLDIRFRTDGVRAGSNRMDISNRSDFMLHDIYRLKSS